MSEHAELLAAEEAVRRLMDRVQELEAELADLRPGGRFAWKSKCEELEREVARLKDSLYPDNECSCRSTGCDHPARYHAVVDTSISGDPERRIVGRGECLIKGCQCEGWR